VVQIPRPTPIGDASVAKQLRSVLFSETLVAAARVRPKGYRRVVLSHLLGWAGPFIARQATEPLPPTILYLAVTTVDIRLFSKPPFADPFEVGRWKKSAYRASLRESGLTLKLDLEVARWGRMTVTSSRGARPVLDLVVQGASGPAL
jgi:hypothetical protein